MGVSGFLLCSVRKHIHKGELSHHMQRRRKVDLENTPIQGSCVVSKACAPPRPEILTLSRRHKKLGKEEGTVGMLREPSISLMGSWAPCLQQGRQGLAYFCNSTESFTIADVSSRITLFPGLIVTVRVCIPFALLKFFLHIFIFFCLKILNVYF